MILVSQNNKMIANLDNIKLIEIQNIGGKYIISLYFKNKDYKRFAEYKTCERAKEILKGITEASIENWKKYVLPEQ